MKRPLLPTYSGLSHRSGARTTEIPQPFLDARLLGDGTPRLDLLLHQRLFHPDADVLTVPLSGGSVYLVGGNNGAGKSLMLRELASRLQRFAPGQAIYFPQDYRQVVFSYKTVWWNICVPLLIHRRVTPPQARDVATRVLNDLGTSGIDVDKRAGQLSGGEQHIVVLGRALVTRHPVVLIDEPEAGLSATALPKALDALYTIATTSSRLIVAVTHQSSWTTGLRPIAHISGLGEHEIYFFKTSPHFTGIRS